MEKHDYAIHLADVDGSGTLVEVLDGDGASIEQTEVDGDYGAGLAHAGQVIGTIEEAAAQG